MSSAIDDWNAQYGNLEDYTKPTGGGRFNFEFGQNYRMRIKSAKVERSTNRGDIQILLDLEVLKQDDTVAGAHKEWLTLPKQESDSTLAGGVDQIIKVTLRRRDDLGRVLAGVDPARFALYASTGDKPGGGTVFFDADGNLLTNSDLDERQVEINARVMEEADQLHGQTGEYLPDWVGAEFWIVKAQNPKSDKYPYTNYHSRPNPKLPIWGGPDA